MKFLGPATLLVLSAGLSACGSSSGSGDKQDGAAAQPAAVAGAVECKDLPPHVVLPADAKVTLCTRGETRPGHVSGAIVYATAMAPDAVLAFYKDKARAAGLSDGISTPGAYSAIDGGKRSFMAMPEAEGGGSKVRLNWGADK